MKPTAETIRREINDTLSRASAARLAFTKKAFRMLPPLEASRILDIGCGRGGPTLKLATLTAGDVVGMDVDRRALDELSKRIGELGLAGRVRAVLGSMRNMDFESESFDIIWAEASIHFIGFEAGLDAVRRFLKPNGFLVIHEMVWLRPDPPRELVEHWQTTYATVRRVPEYLAAIPLHDYEIIGHFALPDDFWWYDYFAPLEHQIREFREKYREDRAILSMLEREQAEVDLYRKYSSWVGSAFFAMRKVAHAAQREERDESENRRSPAR